jgi:hypothetical protein
MLVPIFGSCPTDLSDDQGRIQRTILGELGRVGLEWRSLGTTDYPVGLPLREVLTLAKRCCGGLILGFSQFETTNGTWKRGTPFEVAQEGPVGFPTPWNGLEAGILFALGLPLLVFRDWNVKGGIFDPGVTDLFIHEMPPVRLSRPERKSLSEVMRKWAAKVHAKYYEGT